jgi:tRNAThr (cytosine32-N3)-methyltransferase
MTTAEQKAWDLIDDAHRADPRRLGEKPYELAYADRLVAWVRRLVPEPNAALLLAARAQHLERWALPRDGHPPGRSGYLRWRTEVHRRQGQRVRELLSQAGIEGDAAERVATLVAKAAPRGDADAQALEDAACLVFLETELVPFLHEHPREKTVDVLRKTWRKMSPAGQEAARAIDLPADARDVVAEALR